MRLSRSLCGAGFFAGAAGFFAETASFLGAGFLGVGFLAVFADFFAGTFFAFTAFGAFALAAGFLPAGFLVRVRAKVLRFQGTRFSMASRAAPRAPARSSVELAP